MSENGAACAGCSLDPVDCLRQGKCVDNAENNGSELTAVSYSRAKREKRHYEDPDGGRLILHQSTPCQREVLTERWNCRELTEDEYREKESEAMTPQGLDSRYAS